MFDNNVFIENSCRNTLTDGVVTGYELQTYITYYRGIPLSMVNKIEVVTDGQAVPREDIRCSVDGGEYWFTLDEMETVVRHKWEYNTPMIIRVLQAGGLSAGTHEVELTVAVRTAYIPIPLEGINKRTVIIE